MKKILITGENSYIGTSVEKWLLQEYDKYQIDTISVRGENWKEYDFTPYDVVFHVAGIAHVSSDPKLEQLYYKVNRDLTIEVAKKAKNEGVRQFIFMSSIIVYGDSDRKKRVITKETIPTPRNFYGRSKLEAEKGISQLEDKDFKVLIIRPPMIYGRGSKGNYQKLVKFILKFPVFPNIDNERSMLHIDNLCEFIKLMIDNNESGIFYPQNKEYVRTSEMAMLIAEAHGKKIWLTRIFNIPIKLIAKFSSLVNKVFGNLVFEKSISNYKENYQIRDLKTSIYLTHKDEK